MVANRDYDSIAGFKPIEVYGIQDASIADAFFYVTRGGVRDGLAFNFARLFSQPGVLWVNTVTGNNGNNGASPETALQTMAAAFAAITDHGTIYALGDIREQINSPLGVQGVKIIGIAGGGVRHDDGVRWRSPASATAATPLLTIREQGWEVHNILFVPDANAVTCIRLRRAEDVTWPDGSHAIIRGCKFIGDDTTPVGTGIEDHGGSSHDIVGGCRFHGLVSGIKNTVGAGIASPLRWLVEDNFFENNTNHLTLPGNACRVVRNVFDEGTSNVNTSGGTAGGNFVLDNVFQNNEADIANNDGYTGHATDVWRNFSQNTAAMTVGVPGA